jgi:hypothetical protein
MRTAFFTRQAQTPKYGRRRHDDLKNDAKPVI